MHTAVILLIKRMQYDSSLWNIFLPNFLGNNSLFHLKNDKHQDGVSVKGGEGPLAVKSEPYQSSLCPSMTLID